MTSELNDKALELQRYQRRAESELSHLDDEKLSMLGSESFPPYLQSPYIHYEKQILSYLDESSSVLEIGSGSGQHTGVLVNSGAKVTATDISSSSLELLKHRLKETTGQDVITKVADMEQLPFDDSSFDFVVCSGSLSYGEPCIVDKEIERVLKPGGTIICVDSLNNNPIYRFNRWLHYLRGERSKSTLIRMPSQNRIDSIQLKYESSYVNYFGSLSYAMPLISLLLGALNAKRFSDGFDKLINCRKSAFKFVLVAKGLKK